MNSLIVLVVVIGAACASDKYYGHGYAHPYGRHHYGYGVYPDQHNALRQKYVNKLAEKVGAGTGTADEDGVPGTFVDKNYAVHGYPGVAGHVHAHANYNRHGYGYGYGHPAYGHVAYGPYGYGRGYGFHNKVRDAVKEANNDQ